MKTIMRSSSDHSGARAAFLRAARFLQLLLLLCGFLVGIGYGQEAKRYVVAQKVTGWGSYHPGGWYTLDVKVGVLWETGEFQELPPDRQFQTITGPTGDDGGFVELGAYYVFGAWEDYADFARATSGWATLTAAPGFGPGKNGHWKLSLNGGGGGGGTDIKLNGSVNVKLKGSRIAIIATNVCNQNEYGTSGTLRLRAWASKRKITSGTLSGSEIGVRNLGQLPAGYYYPKISGFVRLNKPRAGSYWIAVLLEEYTEQGWTVRDYRWLRSKVWIR